MFFNGTQLQLKFENSIQVDCFHNALSPFLIEQLKKIKNAFERLMQSFDTEMKNNWLMSWVGGLKCRQTRSAGKHPHYFKQS